MPDDENTPKNPTPEENSIPVSPPSFDHTQDLPESPTLEAPIPSRPFWSVPMPPETPESPTEAESAIPVNNDNDKIRPVEPENPVLEQTPK